MGKLYIVDGRIIKEGSLESLKIKKSGYIKRKIKIIEYNDDDVETYYLDEFIDGYKEKNKRDMRLSVLLSGDSYSNELNFIEQYKKVAPDVQRYGTWLPKQYSIYGKNKNEIVDYLNSILSNKKKFKNFLSINREYFLTKIPNLLETDLEYIKAYLRIHNARLSDSDKVTKTFKNAFNDAKEIVKNEKVTTK